MSKDIAIDLGTATTLAWIPEKGIVMNEPAVVAMERLSARAVAVGRATWKAAAADPETVTATWPFRHGPGRDFAITQRMIEHAMEFATPGRLSRPRMLLVIPTGATEVERRAVEEAALAAGAREVWLIESPLAAALGAMLPIAEPRGSCIIDIGGAATEIAVISMGGMVSQEHVPTGGFDMVDEIVKFLRREYGMSIGERTAEGIKVQVGSAAPLEEELKAEIRGREIATGAPKTVIVTSEEVRAALEDAVRPIIEGVRSVLSRTEPELAHDVLDSGIALCGGGALLRGLSDRIQSETGIPVRIVDRAVEVVCIGAGNAMADLETMHAAGVVLRRAS
ncbi:MAG: rod shape-determining protein MreB [Actinomycetota bacterium]